MQKVNDERYIDAVGWMTTEISGYAIVVTVVMDL